MRASGRAERRGQAFSITSFPIWRIRLTRELPRRLLVVASAAALLACLRLTIAPPRPLSSASRAPAARLDRGAEAYAEMFARRYLTWDAADPEAGSRALAGYLGPGVEAGDGIALPTVGEERVEWLQLVSERSPRRGVHVYTVGAQTDTAGLVYLSVSVERAADGTLSLAGYPAFVGPPATGEGSPGPTLREVDDSALATVATRAIRNYLAGAAGDLAADLTASARVSLPAQTMTVESVESLTWEPDGRSVSAAVRAEDRRGVQFKLAYELDVAREQGRWEISAVQTDPYA